MPSDRTTIADQRSASGASPGRQDVDLHNPGHAHVHGDACGCGHDHGHHHGDHAGHAAMPVRSLKVGRNEPCPCGSGQKYKKCCLARAG